ncbi:MAG: hypothetical protein Rhims3KO_13710 [Hyphomicrobiales bacterium]
MPSRLPHAALGTLIILQLVMLASLFAGLAPHPPRAIPFFAMAPFLGVSMAIAASAMIVQPLAGKLGRTLSALAALCALISYGPQKWMDPAIAEIWPAVLAGEIAAIALLLLVFRAGPCEQGQTA